MQVSMARSHITRLILSNTTSLRLNRITNHHPWTMISKTSTLHQQAQWQQQTSQTLEEIQ
jgi:hypothetical protein